MKKYAYVCRQNDGKAVYVGSSRDVTKRLLTHLARSFWWEYVTTVDVLGPFSASDDALAVERALIDGERPRFNVAGRWAQRGSWTWQECDDFVRALEEINSSHLPEVRRRRAIAERLREQAAS